MALPLYPHLKEDLEDLLMDMAAAAAREELGPFKESPRFIQHEGSRHLYSTIDGEEGETEYQELMVERTFSSSEIASLSFEDALNLVIEKGREMGAQQARYHYARLDQIVADAGTTVSGPLTLDSFFEMLERAFISFDYEGNPRMPTMVIHPNMTPRIQELAEEMERDEAKARLAEIMERKREQWNEEQDRRKLVD